MRPETGAWRKAGRRPGRRSQEHVLDEQRERRSRSRSLPGEVLWRITVSPDEDAPEGYVNVVVTPVVNGQGYPDASCGESVHEHESDVLSLIEQATERLVGLRDLADDLRIIDKYDYQEPPPTDEDREAQAAYDDYWHL